MNIHSIRDAGRLCCLVTMSLVCGTAILAVITRAGSPCHYHFDGTISREVLENYSPLGIYDL